MRMPLAKPAPRRPRRVSIAATADSELIETLDNLDGAASYAAWVFELIEPFVGSRVLEIGAGHGIFTEMLAARGERVVATELSPTCVKVLRERFAGHPRVEVVEGPIESATRLGPFDTAVLINVLEHIEDDTGALEQLVQELEPGGRLIIWAPAFELLYSRFDARIGHYRRYRIGDMRTRIETLGLELREIRYANSVGAIAWFVLARLLHGTPTKGYPVRLFDRWAVPVLKRAETGHRPPFGQSILVAAEKPRATDGG
jgi:SAM-dependent methyltransferase